MYIFSIRIIYIKPIKKTKPNYLAVTSTNVINTFKEQLPNCLSPPTKKDFARLALDTRKFLAERNMSDLVKVN